MQLRFEPVWLIQGMRPGVRAVWVSAISPCGTYWTWSSSLAREDPALCTSLCSDAGSAAVHSTRRDRDRWEFSLRLLGETAGLKAICTETADKSLGQDPLYTKEGKLLPGNKEPNCISLIQTLKILFLWSFILLTQAAPEGSGKNTEPAVAGASGGQSIVLYTERLWARSPVREHTKVAGSVPGRGMYGRQLTDVPLSCQCLSVFLSLAPTLPLHFSLKSVNMS